MEKISVFLSVSCVCAVLSLPLETSDLKNVPEDVPVFRGPQLPGQLRAHTVQRRFINPQFSIGAAGDAGADAGTGADIARMRTKRSYDECEKLQLCKLHARSRQSFFAAYELYFVNKENARLWDHRASSTAECEQRYGDCYYR